MIVHKTNALFGHRYVGTTLGGGGGGGGGGGCCSGGRRCCSGGGGSGGGSGGGGGGGVHRLFSEIISAGFEHFVVDVANVAIFF